MSDNRQLHCFRRRINIYFPRRLEGFLTPKQRRAEYRKHQRRLFYRRNIRAIRRNVEFCWRKEK